MDYQFADLAHGLEPAARALVRALDTGAPGALLIAAPGLGAHALARRLPTAITLSDHQRTWIAIEYQAMGGRAGDVTGAPFRAPHHTVSAAALAGMRGRGHDVRCLTPTTPRCLCGMVQGRLGPTGGVPTSRPGECQLARFGVLLLDQLPEFHRSSLHAAREAMARMGASRPFVVATAAPCPCGYGMAPPPAAAYWRACSCPSEARAAYQARTSAMAAILGLDAPAITLPPISRAEFIAAGPRCADLAALRAPEAVAS